MITPDRLFSYWVFAWFVVYITAPGRVPSPYYALAFSLATNVAALVYYTAILQDARFTILYGTMLTLFKAVPLYLVSDKPKAGAAVATAAISIVYVIYLAARGTSPLHVYMKVDASLRRGTDDTPFMLLMHKWTTHV
jgi:hypothetical protein